MSGGCKIQDRTLKRGGIGKKDCKDNKVIVITPHGLRSLKKFKELNIIAVYIKIPRRDRFIKILQRGDDIEESYSRNVLDIGMFDGIEDEVDFVIDNRGYLKTPNEICNEIAELLKVKRGDKP